MFFDDRRNAVTTILTKRRGNGDVTAGPTPMKPEIHKTEDGELDGKHLAAQDVLAAHHSASPAALMEALGNFIDLHLHSTQGNVPEPEGHMKREPL